MKPFRSWLMTAIALTTKTAFASTGTPIDGAVSGIQIIFITIGALLFFAGLVELFYYTSTSSSHRLPIGGVVTLLTLGGVLAGGAILGGWVGLTAAATLH